MKPFDAPIFFAPILVERVWGGNRLGSLLGKPLPADRTIGESWELSDRPGAESTVAGGAFAGLSIRELIQTHPREILGDASLAARRFPLLVKYVDAGEPLSVQVHPDDAGAEPLGDLGKSECWIVLRAEPGARIVRGLRPGTTRADFARAVNAGSVDRLLHSFEPAPGDVVALPAGMVHAIGAGLVVAEIQQNSDITFRIFDYYRLGLDGKPRTLHVEAALNAIRFDSPGTEISGDMHADTVTPTERSASGSVLREKLLTGKYFDLQRRTFLSKGSYRIEKPAGPTVLMLLEGSALIEEREIHAGMSALIPAASEGFALTTQGRMVCVLSRVLQASC